jgi:hypothetical protein
MTTAWDSAAWASRCTEAAIAAITGERPDVVPMSGAGVLQYLTNNGWNWEDSWTTLKTVKSVCDAGLEGRWYLFTSGHAMALVDGVLTDTEDLGPNGRRVLGLYRVWK